MEMSNSTTHYGWSGVDSHLIKNSEWGAVAYLCYSAFGNVPQINGAMRTRSIGGWCDFYTGAGPKETNNETRYDTWTEETHGYNTALGQLASTTGNVYGIYDMNGGAWETIAAYYDNGRFNLGTYGKSNVHGGSSTEYFDTSSNSLKAEYEKYWEAYKVSDEEKENREIEVDGETVKAREELWSASKKGVEAEQTRHDLVEETWDNLAKEKGIGINEMTENWSYRGLVNGTTIGWKTDPTSKNQDNGQAWNGDFVMIGGVSVPFVTRGGYPGNGSGSGLLYSFGIFGNAYEGDGFRPVLAF